MGVFSPSDLMWVLQWSGVEHALHFVLMPRPKQKSMIRATPERLAQALWECDGG